MMALDPRIILAGQQPNIMASFDAGQQAGARQNAIQQQNALSSLYQTQGAGIAAGDQNALNALAAIDPMAALQVQGQRQNMAATQQRMRMLDDAQRQQLAAQAAQMTEQQRAEQAARIEAGLSGAAFFHQNGDQAGYEGFLRQQGLDPAQYPFEQFPAIAATFGEVLDVWKGFKPEVAKPQSADGKFYADQAAGFVPPDAQPRSQVSITNNMPGQQPQPQLLGTQGLVAIPDPSVEGGWRVQAAPNSPLALEQEQAAAKATERGRQSQIKMGTTLENINLNIGEIENGGLPVTGTIGAIGRMLPGSAATDFANRTTQINTRAALDEVQNMRDNSPTGGAVGQLTDSEREAIGLAATSLSNTSSAEEYLRAAKRFREVMLDTAFGAGNWEIDDQGQLSLKQAVPAGVDPDVWEYMTPEQKALFQ